MTVRRDYSSSFLFLCFHLLVASNAAMSSYILQAINCSTSGNYTDTGAYAANVNQFLGALPENTVSKNGGFFNGTVGLGSDTLYGLAMCPADYSRGDCSDCLTAAASSNADGLRNSCPGSRTVLAMFDRCLVRYSDVNFFGTPEIGERFPMESDETASSLHSCAIYVSSGESVSASWKDYADEVQPSLSEATSGAEISPQRFAASVGRPYVFVQCTWDLPADKCKQCLDILSINVTDIWVLRREGQQKSYSCTVRYSNTSFMVVPFTAVPAPTPQYVFPAGRSSPDPAIASGEFFAYAQRFSYAQLAKSTSNFASEEILGAGAFGTVYKGKLNSMDVAVKKIIMPDNNEEQGQVRKDFDNEINLMRPLHHCNIISLVGCCKDKKNLLLVYELMENGNLEDQLYPKAGSMDSDLHGVTVRGTNLMLDWPKRDSILIGVATGLVYLHCECKEPLLHGDIKPSNVMLGKSFNAKLCDFGLVKQISNSKTTRSTDSIRGTKGYVDPAYANTGKTCEKNDIYSFGIVMLEVVCCVRPSVTQNGDRILNNLVEKPERVRKNLAILKLACNLHAFCDTGKSYMEGRRAPDSCNRVRSFEVATEIFWVWRRSEVAMRGARWRGGAAANVDWLFGGGRNQEAAERMAWFAVVDCRSSGGGNMSEGEKGIDIVYNELRA
ncbi:hypothetical protein QYE76_059519 [Lolium multiflorum]|uniref:Uncharacterized protein n=1 Tax=Lolium multiflorum TaxID=4521 RepID=A0AAD8RXB2_LOLMU|nr:hypothetical protein QYE76_059519 [Lolium multiflorum]